MVSGDTPTSPLVFFCSLESSDSIQVAPIAVALKATKSLTAFSRLSTLLAHLEHICEESLSCFSCFSTGMSITREILCAHLFWIPIEVKKMHCFGVGHQRSAQPADYTSLSHRCQHSVSVCHMWIRSFYRNFLPPVRHSIDNICQWAVIAMNIMKMRSVCTRLSTEPGNEAREEVNVPIPPKRNPVTYYAIVLCWCMYTFSILIRMILC